MNPANLFVQKPPKWLYLWTICILLPNLIETIDKTNLDWLPVSEPFIVNGQPVSDGEMPHQFAIFRDVSQFICAGSFIGPRTGLSAAHCFYRNDLNPDHYTIHYSSVNLTQHRIRRSRKLSVLRIVLHPAFNHNTLDNDLAVLTFPEPFQWSNGSGTIDIQYRPEPEDNSELVVSGWGAVGPMESTSTEQLLSARLTKLNQQTCRERWAQSGASPGMVLVTDQMFCGHSTRQSACNGDSGGPVTQNGKLVGIISWGPDTCLNRMLPNVFVKLAQFQDWIEVNLI